MTKLKIRFARQSDKEAVLAFCQKLQDAYIINVWDKWLNDSSGRIFVATIDDAPVAIQRVVLMSQNEAWWEGLRVDFRYQRQGISKVLEYHRDKYLQENDIKILRCCIYFYNDIMSKILSRRTEWKKIENYSLYYCKKPFLVSQKTILIQLKLNDFDSAISLIKEKDLYVSIGAKWQELTSKQLKKLLIEKKVWGLKQNNQLTNIVIKSKSETSQPKFWIGYIGGIKENLPILLQELKKLAYQQNCSYLGGFLPFNQIFNTSFSLAGYQMIEEEKCEIYERRNERA